MTHQQPTESVDDITAAINIHRSNDDADRHKGFFVTGSVSKRGKQTRMLGIWVTRYCSGLNN